MGNFASTKTVVIYVGKQEETCCDSLLAYLQRPIIYYCFALPLLAPSVMLIIVSHLGDDVDTGFQIVGYILFFLCVLSFSTGIALGIRDLRRMAAYRNASGLLDPGRPRGHHSPTAAAAGNIQSLSVTNSASSTAPSSRRSSSNASLTSLGSQSNSVGVLSTIDKSKFISLKKKHMRRKRGVKFPVNRLPSLIEEDTHIKSLSRGNSQSVFAQDTLPGYKKDTLGELKDYLQAIGIGGAAGPQVPHALNVGVDRRAKTCDEEDFRRKLDKDAATQHTPQTVRYQRRGSLGGDQNKQPVLVATSHEKTGIGFSHVR